MTYFSENTKYKHIRTQNLAEHPLLPSYSLRQNARELLCSGPVGSGVKQQRLRIVRGDHLPGGLSGDYHDATVQRLLRQGDPAAGLT